MSRRRRAGIGLACALLAWAAVPGFGAEEKARKREVHVRVGGGTSLGVSLEEVRDEDVSRLRLPEERGAVVESVEPDSPAAAAGLQKDDVIVSYQGEPVHSAVQLSRLVRETPGGRKVTLEVSRDGARQALTATLREGRAWLAPGDLDFDFDVPIPAIDVRPPRPPRAPRPPKAELFDFDFREFGDVFSKRPRLGLTYQELTEQLAGYFKVEGGLLVTSVNEDSPAAQAGVKAGDVIVRANDRDVRSSDDLRGVLDGAEAGAEITLGLRRDGKALDLKARLAEPRERTVRRKTIRS
jgi:C-terminal processing protease CtpA/Prc